MHLVLFYLNFFFFLKGPIFSFLVFHTSRNFYCILHILGDSLSILDSITLFCSMADFVLGDFYDGWTTLQSMSPQPSAPGISAGFLQQFRCCSSGKVHVKGIRKTWEFNLGAPFSVAPSFQGFNPPFKVSPQFPVSVVLRTSSVFSHQNDWSLCEVWSHSPPFHARGEMSIVKHLFQHKS